MKGSRRLSAVHLLRRGSDSSNQSVECEGFNQASYPTKQTNPLQPSIKEEEEEDDCSSTDSEDDDFLPKRYILPEDGGEPDNTKSIEAGIDVTSDYSGRSCTFTKCVKMVAACLTFVPVGMATTILGPTLLELQEQTATTSGDLALLFTWRGMGAVGGNLLTGVAYQRTRPEVLLCTSVVLLGLTQSAIPLSSSYGFLVTAVIGSGVAIGILGAGLNAYVVELWKARSAPFIQALHFSVSFGSMMGPLITVPFLGSLSAYAPHSGQQDNQVDIAWSDKNYTSIPFRLEETLVHKEDKEPFEGDLIVAGDEGELGIALGEMFHRGSGYTYSNNQSDTIANGTNQVLTFDKDINSVLLYPYLTIAIVCGLACLLYVYIIFCKCHQQKAKVLPSSLGTKEGLHHSNHVYQLIGLILLNLICVCSGSMEGAFGGYIAVFGIKRLQMSSTTAAFLATTFWACFACGRGLSILVVQCLKPQTILVADWFVVSLCLFVFFIFHQSHIAITFVSCSLIGLALSTVLGNVLSYTNTNVVISAKVTASFVISFYCGMMVSPSLVGFLMDMYTPDVMLYFLFGVALCALTIFSFLHFVLIKKLVMK